MRQFYIKGSWNRKTWIAMKLALQEATDTKKRFFSSGICYSNNLCYITSSLNVPALNLSVWFFHAAYFFL